MQNPYPQIFERNLSADEYIQKPTKKDMIFIHHTAGAHNPAATIDSWNRDTRGRIGTAFVIGGRSTIANDTKFDGQIYQAFDPKFWGFHLGIEGTNGRIDKKSIGIEICNYGYLTLSKSGVLYNWVNKPVPEYMAYELDSPWRGHKYFHRYTDAQLESLRKLLLSLGEEFGINIRKKWSQSSFGVSKDALNGTPGLWTHVNVRKDKTDCHPQPELIQVLNSL